MTPVSVESYYDAVTWTELLNLTGQCECLYLWITCSKDYVQTCGPNPENRTGPDPENREGPNPEYCLGPNLDYRRDRNTDIVYVV
jgi:hypothetical protein